MEKTKIFTTNDYSLFKHESGRDLENRFKVYLSTNYDDFLVLQKAAVKYELPDEVMDCAVVVEMKHKIGAVIANADVIERYKALNLPVKYVLVESIDNAYVVPESKHEFESGRDLENNFNVYSSLNYDDFFVLPEASMLNEIPDEVMDYVVVTRMKHQVWGVVANAHLIEHYKALNLPVMFVLKESIRKAVPKAVPDAIEPESVRDAMEVSKHLSDFTSSISESMLKVKQVAAELGVSVGEVISLYNVLNLAQARKK